MKSPTNLWENQDKDNIGSYVTGGKSTHFPQLKTKLQTPTFSEDKKSSFRERELGHFISEGDWEKSSFLMFMLHSYIAPRQEFFNCSPDEIDTQYVT